MRELQAGSRSRPFLLLPAHALGVKALGVHGQRRCGRRVAPGRLWCRTSASLSLSLSPSLSSGPQYPSKLPSSRAPVVTHSPFLEALDCPKKGGGTDCTRI